VAKYPFLSDEWVTEARKLRAEYQGKVPAAAVVVRMNQVITDVPFGEGRVMAHLDTSSGEPELDLGHLDSPDLTVTTDYQTARAIFVDANPQAAMNAFMSGKIKVDGDISKLIMTVQTAGPLGVNDPKALELVQRLHDLTE
jgi:hypothetical protein